MELALEEAQKAAEHGDVPIGCVIVHIGNIVASTHNRVEKDQDSTAHAEILAIREAQKSIGYKHLLDCDMYITLEPCAMCAGAIVLSRVNRLFIATADPKSGACGSVMDITNNPELNHRCEVHYGIYESESSELLKNFFKKIRERNGRRS
ncbi:MAG: tRNA-specific adenosine deaminase [Ignavibacteriae bacterium HGW-Ignavibacteriae-4]|jgi:tRNA(adenine34) deaminase|nr:MAG: tRNA-specific adenosine deaminase [Ignavibacteriae bacterium HGW-Ignavibacteriae-4]